MFLDLLLASKTNHLDLSLVPTAKGLVHIDDIGRVEVTDASIKQILEIPAKIKWNLKQIVRSKTNKKVKSRNSLKKKSGT
jgi:predicted DNA-binding helix-hairpin-helix protein